jgi:hypothetical protein
MGESGGGEAGREPGLRAADARVIAAIDGIVAVHPNELHWWNNASFALPFLAAVVSLALGLIAGLAEATGFGLFMLAVTVLTSPVVIISWRRTPTAIAVTEGALVTLHAGHELRRLRWNEVESVRTADYDEVRWRVFPHEGGHLSLESGIARLPALIDEVCARASVERPTHERELREGG